MTATAAMQPEDTVAAEIRDIATAAKQAGQVLSLAQTATKNDALRQAAARIRDRVDSLLAANAKGAPAMPRQRTTRLALKACVRARFIVVSDRQLGGKI